MKAIRFANTAEALKFERAANGDRSDDMMLDWAQYYNSEMNDYYSMASQYIWDNDWDYDYDYEAEDEEEHSAPLEWCQEAA